MTLLDFLLGRRLANKESQSRRIGAFEAVPAMGLDALGSSAYGPEAALTALLPLGAAAVACIGWVMTPIVLLLGILFASYWQTIRAYPNNGGAYTVARENLGTNASLLAAAALMIDYVLNVAVGISAGVGALVSAMPALHPHILPLCLGLLALITLVNLRGTPETGRLFAVPTYLFVGCFGTILVLGAGAAIMAGGHPQPVVAPSAPAGTAQAVSVWLLLRAFASGCTAMTGVEAVSNSMGTLREPRVKEGHRTLSIIVTILALLLAGISFLSWAYHIGAMDQTRAGYRSVLAQLAAAVLGQGVFYYLAVGSVLAVLALSANTSFVGFPLLCRTVAADGFLPKSFAIAGHRLVFSVGITFLAGFAAVLLSAFGGITDRLIPLFAIGAFLTFTLSQLGMVVHWQRARSPAAVQTQAQQPPQRSRLHLGINAAGVIVTGAALVVIVIGKFTEGAWITILVIPAVIALLKSIKRYYERLETQVRAARPLRIGDVSAPIVLLATEGWSKLTAEALNFAMSLSSVVVAVHLSQLSGPEGGEEDRRLREQWRQDVELPVRAAGREPPKLVILQAQYRDIHEPMIRLAEQLASQHPGRRIAVLIPELIKQHWYQYILHTRRARSLRARLLRHAGARLTVITVPWRLDEKSVSVATSSSAAQRRRA